MQGTVFVFFPPDHSLKYPSICQPIWIHIRSLTFFTVFLVLPLVPLLAPLNYLFSIKQWTRLLSHEEMDKGERGESRTKEKEVWRCPMLQEAVSQQGEKEPVGGKIERIYRWLWAIPVKRAQPNLSCFAFVHVSIEHGRTLSQEEITIRRNTPEWTRKRTDKEKENNKRSCYVGELYVPAPRLQQRRGRRGGERWDDGRECQGTNGKVLNGCVLSNILSARVCAGLVIICTWSVSVCVCVLTSWGGWMNCIHADSVQSIIQGNLFSWWSFKLFTESPCDQSLAPYMSNSCFLPYIILCIVWRVPSLAISKTIFQIS